MTYDEILEQLNAIKANGEQTQVHIANAINQLDRALEIIKGLPDEPSERASQ